MTGGAPATRRGYDDATLPSYETAFHHATAHGVLSAVTIPDAPDPVPEEVLARLLPEEAEHARTLRKYRQVQFVGGRLALRLALEQMNAPTVPALSDDRGAPILPRGFVGSISHKRDLAVAMVARAAHGSLGVDLEDYLPARNGIADRILVAEEIEAIEALPEDRRWIALVLRFSVKEAIYKALDPFVRRYVDFHEAIVHPDLYGRADVRLVLAQGEGPFEVEARYEWLHGRIVTSVRIRRSMRPSAQGESSG